MTRGLLPVALLLFFMHAAEAGSLRLGDMTLAYDATRWRVGISLLSPITLHAIGEIDRVLDPVGVRQEPARDVADCEALARKALSNGMYDDDLLVETLAVAGADAIRAEAVPLCRNAMPRGVAMCVVHGGSGYLLTVSHSNCRSGANNLFSGIDPLQELVDGIRFVP